MAIDLTTNVGGVLKLSSPFWIASAHYSENEKVLKRWTEYAPSAITLKTCTRMDRTEKDPKQLIRMRTQDALPRYGRSYYSDGPKERELQSYEQIEKLLQRAKTILPKTMIGISVLATPEEDFTELLTRCDQADFFELNLKYSMRSKEKRASFFDSVQGNWQATLDIVDRFLEALTGRSLFVKLPRELDWLPSTAQADDLLDRLNKHGRVGLVVANTRKADVAPFMHDDEEQLLQGGVFGGDTLYDGTIAMIEGLRPACDERNIPIVASGGMVDEQQILMAIRTGATAVQLCTAFDYNGLLFYETLQAGLRERIKWRGKEDVDAFFRELRAEKTTASVYSMPFRYSPSFWAPALQKQIQTDIRLSRRMDIVIASGRTLLDEWGPVMSDRVIQRLLSVRALILNPRSPAFDVVQHSWGTAEHREVEARRERVLSSQRAFDELFKKGRSALVASIKERVKAVSESDLDGPLEQFLKDPEGESARFSRSIKAENERRKDKDLERLPNPEWGALFYDKCPFYSMYIFDDKAYIAMYPFIRPGRSASPVYIYSRSSAEYGRLDREFTQLWANYLETSDSGRGDSTVSS